MYKAWTCRYKMDKEITRKHTTPKGVEEYFENAKGTCGMVE